MITEQKFTDKFSELVVKHMEVKNISNDTLASKIGSATETISRLRNKHKKRISAYLMMKIVKALGIPLKEIDRIL